MHHIFTIALLYHSFGSGSDESHFSPYYFLALLPLSGLLFYWRQMRRYRNKDASYQYEHSTRARVWNIQVADKFVGKVHATRHKHVVNYDQSSNPRRRVRPLP